MSFGLMVGSSEVKREWEQLIKDREGLRQIFPKGNSNIFVVDDQEQLDKVESIRDQLPEVKHVVQIGDYRPDGPSPNGTYSVTSPDVITWDKLLQVVGIQKRSLSPLFIFCFHLLFSSSLFTY